MDDGGGQQQRLAERRLPRNQENASPSLHQVDRDETESEIAQMPGNEQEQDEAADEPRAPQHQTRKHLTLGRPPVRRVALQLNPQPRPAAKLFFAAASWRSGQHDDLAAGPVLLHAAMRLDNLTKLEDPADLDAQLIRGDLLDQFIEGVKIKSSGPPS